MMAPPSLWVRPTGGSRRVFGQFARLEAGSVKQRGPIPPTSGKRKPLGRIRQKLPAGGLEKIFYT